MSSYGIGKLSRGHICFNNNSTTVNMVGSTLAMLYSMAYPYKNCIVMFNLNYGSFLRCKNCCKIVCDKHLGLSMKYCDVCLIDWCQKCISEDEGLSMKSCDNDHCFLSCCQKCFSSTFYKCQSCTRFFCEDCTTKILTNNVCPICKYNC